MVRFLHHLQQLEQVKSVEAHTLMVNFLRSDMVTIIINLKQVKEQTKKRRSLVRAAEDHCGNDDSRASSPVSAEQNLERVLTTQTNQIPPPSETIHFWSTAKLKKRQKRTPRGTVACLAQRRVIIIIIHRARVTTHKRR